MSLTHYQGTLTVSSSSSPLISHYSYLEEVGTPCGTSAEHGPMKLAWLLGWSLGEVCVGIMFCIFTDRTLLEIPVNEYYEYFGPDYKLDVKSSNTEDMNTPEYLERVKNIVLDNVRRLKGPPSVQMSGAVMMPNDTLYLLDLLEIDIPKLPIDDAIDDMNQDEDLIPPDERRHRRLLDSRVQADGELSDSDDEGEGGRRDRVSYKDRGSESRSRSSETDGGTMRFGIGGGILGSGPAGSTHGAGPSGYTTLVLQTTTATASMDVDDTPSTTGREITPVEAVRLEDSVSSGEQKDKDKMAVDEISPADGETS